MAFDASPSWSGFNYQGKVAIYCALQKINQAPSGTDLSKYSLMLENVEDFEILLDGKSISLHQVKAYNSSTYSDYSNALLSLTLELYKQPDITGRIHTWKLINPKPGCLSLIESIKNDLEYILNQYKIKNPKDGSTILEKAASSDKNIEKTAAILRAAFPNKTSNELYTLLDSIYRDQNFDLARLDSYKYDDGNSFCDINEVNNKIKCEIEKAMKARSVPITTDQLDKTFHYFLGMMDRYIIQRHKTKQSEIKIPIKFNEITYALENDHADISQEYLALKFKERFLHLIDEYIGDDEDYQTPESDEICNLKEIRKFLFGLAPLELWVHYRNFSPQIDLQHSNHTENAFSINDDGIRYNLIKIFHSMDVGRVSHNSSKHMFTYCTRVTPHQHYLPTTITNSGSLAQIEKKIVSNINLTEILYEVGNLVYNQSDQHTFALNSVVHTEAPSTEDEDPRTKRHEVLKQITLVPILTAKDALNK